MTDACLVTGANSGIGLAASTELARRGYTVLMACRDVERGREALERVRRESGGKAELLALDLASLASVRAAAEEARARHPKLAVLVNNAGVFTRRRQTTADGFELTFGVNHLGHFLLTRLLEPALQAPSRVVNVSSDAHRAGALDFDDLNLERSWGSWRAYCASKLANVLFTIELAKRWKGGGSVNAVHPGGIATNIFRDLPGLIQSALSLVLGSPERGARPVVRLAIDSDVAGVTGKYFDKLKERAATARAQDEDAAARLWAASERLVGLS